MVYEIESPHPLFLQLKATQDALQERDARARHLERELTSERGARAAAEAESASAKSEAAGLRDALQNQGLEVERAHRASEDLGERLRDEAQMRLGLVEKTEVRQLERALGDKEAELQRCRKKLSEGATKSSLLGGIVQDWFACVGMLYSFLLDNALASLWCIQVMRPIRPFSSCLSGDLVEVLIQSANFIDDGSIFQESW